MYCWDWDSCSRDSALYLLLPSCPSEACCWVLPTAVRFPSCPLINPDYVSVACHQWALSNQTYSSSPALTPPLNLLQSWILFPTISIDWMPALNQYLRCQTPYYLALCPKDTDIELYVWLTGLTWGWTGIKPLTVGPGGKCSTGDAWIQITEHFHHCSEF